MYMVNRRRKQSEKEDLYRTDFHRLSSYPTYRDTNEKIMLNQGDLIKVTIGNMDENGRGLALYKNYKVFVKGEVYPGDKVNVRIESIKGNTIIGTVEQVEERNS